MTQHQALLSLFYNNNKQITLGAIMQTTLAAEYRARISELRRMGYVIECVKGKTPSENLYRLVSAPLAPVKIVEAEGGQMVIQI